MDQRALGLSCVDRHPQCRQHDASAHPAAHRPAHDPARIEIHHHRQVQPSLMRGDIRDVGSPTLIGSMRREVPFKQILRHRMARITLRRDPKAPLRTSSKPLQSHQSCHLMATDADTRSDQFRMHPGTAIDTVTLGMHASNLRHQLSVSLRPIALRPGPPSVITTPRHVQQSAHHANRITTAAAINTRILHLDRLAKYAAASLKKSRSFLTWPSSRLSVASSSSRV